MTKLGVNIDHIATLRQARKGIEPDPVSAALVCLKSGANSIVAHLREDRRHIQDADVYALRKVVRKNFNLEMSINPSVVKVAIDVKPDQVTLVPERRQELTTEGGLDVAGNFRKLTPIIADFNARGIVVSLFVAPDRKQIDACRDLKAAAIEIHTGCYADARNRSARVSEFKKIRTMAQYGNALGLLVNAGHGLNYQNTQDIAGIPEILELNIGHSIMARSVTTGLAKAVKEMMILCRGK
jgi:pyridoxine 5-phosphate synthase